MGEIVAPGGWCAPSSAAIEDLQAGDVIWKAASRYIAEQDPPQAIRGGLRYGAPEPGPFFRGIRND